MGVQGKFMVSSRREREKGGKGGGEEGRARDGPNELFCGREPCRRGRRKGYRVSVE